MRNNFNHNTLERLALKHFSEEQQITQFQPVSTGRFNSSYIFEINKKGYLLRIAPPRDTGLIFYEKNMMAQEPAEIVLSVVLLKSVLKRDAQVCYG